MCSVSQDETISSVRVPFSHNRSISFCKRVFKNCTITDFSSAMSSSLLIQDKILSSSYCAGLIFILCSITLCSFYAAKLRIIPECSKFLTKKERSPLWVPFSLFSLNHDLEPAARARSRSEELEQARLFAHLITTFLPLMI